MFSPCYSHDVLDGHTDLFILLSVYWIRISDMDSSRKKLTFKWIRTAVTSPTRLQGGDAGPDTPSRWSMSPNEDSNTLLLSDSPGPDGLGELSLDTPKRKAEVLSESVPSLGKVKLRKLSRKNYEHFITSEVNFQCKSCSLLCYLKHCVEFLLRNY